MTEGPELLHHTQNFAWGKGQAQHINNGTIGRNTTFEIWDNANLGDGLIHHILQEKQQPVIREWIVIQNWSGNDITITGKVLSFYLLWNKTGDVILLIGNCWFPRVIQFWCNDGNREEYMPFTTLPSGTPGVNFKSFSVFHYFMTLSLRPFSHFVLQLSWLFNLTFLMGNKCLCIWH